MNVDDILFSPVVSDLDLYHEKIWKFFLELIPPECDLDLVLSQMHSAQLEMAKQSIYFLLEYYGNPYIENSNQLRDLINANTIETLLLP